MRYRWGRALLALAVCGAGAGAGLAGPATCDQTPLVFRAPVRVGGGQGYEPGIEIDSAGTVFVTAHKLSLLREEGRFSSLLFRSTDGGRTFESMSGLGGATNYGYSFEGDLAVDRQDRLYFVDTWAGDLHVSRYSNHGATLDFYRPALPSAEPDDRPWIAAHGDGVVYYLSNGVAGYPGRLVVHRSTDGGQTFDPVGYTLPRSGWGFIDADPNSDYVYAVANDLFYGETDLFSPAHAATGVWANISADRGLTWTRVKIGAYAMGYEAHADHDDAYPVVAVSPADGSVYALWSDDGRALMLARSTDHGETWTVNDVTPFDGVYSFPWMTVGPTGDVGISFVAHPSAEENANHYVYAMVWRPESSCSPAGDPSTDCAGPASSYARVSPRSVGGYSSQADFFQLEFSPDNSLDVVYTAPGNKIMHARQNSGPDLAASCGVSGTP